MTSLSNYQSEFISKAYDFSGCKTVVDVGGGHGFLLLTVLKDNPHLKGVLFDLPHVVAGALPRIELEGMNDRCETVGGNFLETAPAGGDIYMMKYIIHDWDDERCLRILQHCRRGMNPGGRVLVIDSVLPPDDSPYMGKYIDMEMLVFTPGGRERTEEQFHDLFRRAGLRLNRMIPTGMYLNIVEGVME
jgi:ubiquinone/menaquinone biosynthesis C-methylase UbiE